MDRRTFGKIVGGVIAAALTGIKPASFEVLLEIPGQGIFPVVLEGNKYVCEALITKDLSVSSVFVRIMRDGILHQREETHFKEQGTIHLLPEDTLVVTGYLEEPSNK